MTTKVIIANEDGPDDVTVIVTDKTDLGESAHTYILEPGCLMSDFVYKNRTIEVREKNDG